MSGVESIPSSRGTRADVIFHHNRPLVPAQPLASVFRDVTDPRDRRGVRHDPPTILCLGCDGDPATYITRSSRTTRRSPLAIRARTAVRLMDMAAAILGGRNVRRPHRIPPPSMTNASPPPDPEGYSGVVRVATPRAPWRAVARLGEVHDVNTGADTRTEGGRRPGGCPVRPHRPRPSNAADPAQAPRSARSPLNPRERTSSRRSRGLPGDLAGYPAISRTATPIPHRPTPPPAE